MSDVAGAQFQPDEASLIAGLRAGSEEAFEWLIARFHQPVYSLLARTTDGRADAADLTREVFVKLSREVRSIRGESTLRTWIYRVALREAATRRRRPIRRWQQEIPMPLKDHLVNHAEALYEIAGQKRMQARVEGALRNVPEPFRTTLILRDIEGFPYEEIAEIERVKLGTVKSRMVRGRTCLKALLRVPAELPNGRPISPEDARRSVLCHSLRESSASLSPAGIEER